MVLIVICTLWFENRVVYPFMSRFIRFQENKCIFSTCGHNGVAQAEIEVEHSSLGYLPVMTCTSRIQIIPEKGASVWSLKFAGSEGVFAELDVYFHWFENQTPILQSLKKIFVFWLIVLKKSSLKHASIAWKTDILCTMDYEMGTFKYCQCKIININSQKL